MNTVPVLHMLSFRPDMQRLMRLAAREHLLPAGGDLGYALHAVFAASFATLAPKPFVLLPPGAQGRDWRLLAYSGYPLGTLRTYAEAFADPDFLASLALGTAEEKTMPRTFQQGMRLAFRLRVRPVVRTGKPNPNGIGFNEGSGKGKARESDAYQAAAVAVGNAAGVSRGKVYSDWLETRLTDAGATLETVSLDAFRLTRLMTRDRSNGEKANRHTEGPDATMLGILRIADPTAFGAALRRGIGRHRSFGFGMLLLAPSQ